MLQKEKILWTNDSRVNILVKKGKEFFVVSTMTNPPKNNDEYFPQKCPVCNNRVFDATLDSVGSIQVYCDKCDAIVKINLNGTKYKSFTEQIGA